MLWRAPKIAALVNRMNSRQYSLYRYYYYYGSLPARRVEAAVDCLHVMII
ncbi:MAG TPA: hypothetical protein VGX92_13420 [Pyrinomonadaceae bacterium]|nr:hypothetical protein [Pyrinomonadaceae bacterium]